MAQKIFTDESLVTFVDETKSYVNKQLSDKADKEHNHDDVYETKEDSQMKYDELKELASVQVDWNQSDASAVDYVKNRTHYETAEQIKNNIFNETLTFETDGTGTAGHHLYYGMVATSIESFEVDKVYNIIIDGQDFGNIVCSNGSTLTIGGTGQDIYWMFSISNGELYVDTYDTSSSHQIQISAVNEVINVKQLDEKYIPDTIARKSDIPNVDVTIYETKDDAKNKLDEAKLHTDTEIANLINSAPTTLDTLGEIATAMEENADVVQALDEAIGSKADANHKHDDLYDTKGAANTALETAKGYADTHINDTDIHVTATDKDTWNNTLDNAKSYTDTKVSDTIKNYYTKTEIDNMELITVEDIDAVCGTTL